MCLIKDAGKPRLAVSTLLMSELQHSLHDDNTVQVQCSKLLQ